MSIESKHNITNILLYLILIMIIIIIMRIAILQHITYHNIP